MWNVGMFFAWKKWLKRQIVYQNSLDCLPTDYLIDELQNYTVCLP